MRTYLGTSRRVALLPAVAAIAAVALGLGLPSGVGTQASAAGSAPKAARALALSTPSPPPSLAPAPPATTAPTPDTAAVTPSPPAPANPPAPAAVVDPAAVVAAKASPAGATPAATSGRLADSSPAPAGATPAGGTATAAAPVPAPQPASTSGGLKAGISYGDTLPWLSVADLNAALDDAVAVGVGWIRMDLSWSSIQPSSASSSAWGPYDRVIAAARARNLNPLLVVAYTPGWARPAGCTSFKCAPNPAQFAVFAGTAAARYGPQGVHTWEIWNEPNGGFWLPTPNAAQYVALLRASATAIRAADPAAFVISGGLAPKPTTATTISQLDFLKGMGDAGGFALVDAVGWHPYTYPAPPSYPASWSSWSKMASTPTSAASILASYGYPAIKLWLTEYGAPTNGPGLMATATNEQYNVSPPPDHVDEALQAQMATESVQLAEASPVVSSLFWYSYKDLGTATSTNENFFGLRRYDGSAKPAWAALQHALLAAR